MGICRPGEVLERERERRRRREKKKKRGGRKEEGFHRSLTRMHVAGGDTAERCGPVRDK